MNIKVKKDEFANHVKRVCKPNLKRNAKICQKCPFLNAVLNELERDDIYFVSGWDDKKYLWSPRGNKEKGLK